MFTGEKDIFVLIVFLAGLAFLALYNMLKAIRNINQRKRSTIIRVEITNVNWKSTEDLKMNYLYPDEMLELSYTFEVDGRPHQRTEQDSNFVFKKKACEEIFEVGNTINAHLPFDKNPKKVSFLPLENQMPNLIMAIILFLLPMSLLVFLCFLRM